MENIDTKRKRQMTPEMLEKLKLARIKANEVRLQKSLKLKEIASLEKKAIKKQMDDKIDNLKKIVEPVAEVTKSDFVEPEKIPESIPVKSKEIKKVSKPQKLKEIIEAESDSSTEGSEDDDDDDESDLVKDFLKKKYKQKYREKYQSQVLNKLTKGIANNHVKARLNDELLKLASANIFG